jgi:hypothetical protein
VSELFFIFGFIWILTGIGSFLLAPFVGFDRKRVKNEVLKFYMAQSESSIKKPFILALIFIAALGFLIPAIYPIVGVVFGFVFWVMCSLFLMN